MAILVLVLTILSQFMGTRGKLARCGPVSYVWKNNLIFNLG